VVGLELGCVACADVLHSLFDDATWPTATHARRSSSPTGSAELRRLPREHEDLTVACRCRLGEHSDNPLTSQEGAERMGFEIGVSRSDATTTLTRQTLPGGKQLARFPRRTKPGRD
jgi:hypothetical protein